MTHLHSERMVAILITGALATDVGLYLPARMCLSTARLCVSLPLFRLEDTLLYTQEAQHSAQRAIIE
jgi:hypothetical protein